MYKPESRGPRPGGKSTLHLDRWILPFCVMDGHSWSRSRPIPGPDESPGSRMDTSMRVIVGGISLRTPKLSVCLIAWLALTPPQARSVTCKGGREAPQVTRQYCWLELPCAYCSTNVFSAYLMHVDEVWFYLRPCLRLHGLDSRFPPHGTAKW